MSLALIQQNAKTLMESIYEYERLLAGKASEKELKKVSEYAKKLIESMRDSARKELKHG